MFWSQPKPCAKNIVAGPLPDTLTLLRVWTLIAAAYSGRGSPTNPDRVGSELEREQEVAHEKAQLLTGAGPHRALRAPTRVGARACYFFAASAASFSRYFFAISSCSCFGTGE